jgi:hypothetical protein
MGPLDDKEKKNENNQNENKVPDKKLEDVSGGIFPIFDSGSDIDRLFTSRVDKNLFED